MFVFGTRPEAIKMCPLVLELKKHREINCQICLTGQHREMLHQVMEAFEIQEDYNLNIMQERQTLTTITTSVLEKMDPVLHKAKPDLVLVHGDTTTSFAAALAAFYQQIPVGHIEAGLRTGNIYSPFPEEMNRLLTGRIAVYHFAPTKRNMENLIRENVSGKIFITGNTVIDAFKITVKENYRFCNPTLRQIDFTKHRIILVTAHRRENLGSPLEHICHAIRRLTERFSDIKVVYPVHLNPIVRETVFRILNGNPQMELLEPLDVLDMHNLIARSFMVMTDSGGLQEEAPSFGKPVLVLRTETERPEAVEAGTVKVAGVEEENIVDLASELLSDTNKYSEMAKAVNPYGNGYASEQIARIILESFSSSFK